MTAFHRAIAHLEDAKLEARRLSKDFVNDPSMNVSQSPIENIVAKS